MTTKISSSPLDLLIRNKETTYWFSYHQLLNTVLKKYIEQNETKEQANNLSNSLKKDYIYEPKKLYLLTEKLIAEINNKCPRSYFQKIGFGLSQEQKLATALTHLHKIYSKEHAGNCELEIQHDIVQGENSKLMSVVSSIQVHIEMLEARKNQLEKHEMEKYISAIEFLEEEKCKIKVDFEDIIADKDSLIESLQNDKQELEETIKIQANYIKELETTNKALKETLNKLKADFENYKREQDQRHKDHEEKHKNYEKEQKSQQEQLQKLLEQMIKMQHDIEAKNQQQKNSSHPEEPTTTNVSPNNDDKQKTPSKKLQNVGVFAKATTPQPPELSYIGSLNNADSPTAMSYSPGFKAFINGSQPKNLQPRSKPVIIARKLNM